MNSVEAYVSNEAVKNAFQNTNFGGMSHRDLIRYGLLKTTCGYYNGHTLKSILIELGLITDKLVITKLGKQYLYEAFSNGTSV